MILQMVSRYVCYNGDRNFSCMTMSIRLAGVLLCSFRDFNEHIGKPIKNLVLNF